MSKKMIVISVKFPEDLLVKLNEYAFRRGLSRSEVIRIAVEIFLELYKTVDKKILVKHFDDKKSSNVEISVRKRKISLEV
jgi:metal-responsive CopG/Arc/MetJ family transcriptional regulator